MEFLPLVSATSGERTGVVLPRHEAKASQEAWCQTTNIYVLNQHGHLLCHQRSQKKDSLPGVWVTHLGGHVGVEETFETNAHKELGEEAGIHVDPSQLLHWRTTKIDRSRLWVREFVLHIDDREHTLIAQPGEVDAFRWMPISEILREQKEAPASWCAGTHDIFVEYHCLRAALTLAQTVGIIQPPVALHAWHPVSLPA